MQIVKSRKARGSMTLLDQRQNWRIQFHYSTRRDAGVRSGKLSWMYAELLHARKQGRAIDAKACGSSIVTTNTSFAFRKCAHDLFALLSGLLVINTFLAIERVESFFHNSAQSRHGLETPPSALLGPCKLCVVLRAVPPAICRA